MILPIVAYGDPVLRKVGREIDANYPNLKELIEDMRQTMYNAQGGGLAAPQIGKDIRLFLIDATPFAEDDDLTEEEKNTLEIRLLIIDLETLMFTKAELCITLKSFSPVSKYPAPPISAVN